MVLSYCVPCHKRLFDLASALPAVAAAANHSPPVEVVLVDYANEITLDSLRCVRDARRSLTASNTLNVVSHRGRDHYHMAHARNLSVRKYLSEPGIVWMQPVWDDYVGVLVCRREELIAAGGYDEGFEFYGSEDKDLNLRLRRRGGRMCRYAATYELSMTRTSNAAKIAGYRPGLSKRDMLDRGSALLKSNVARGVLVANEGQPWGQ
jgi:hypothetical protein